MWNLTSKCPVSILMFHSVGSEVSQRSVSPKNSLNIDVFERIIKEVSLRYRPLTIAQALRNKRCFWAKAFRRGIVVTLDDGFRDNLTVVLPILERYKVPAIIYVTTGYVDRTVYPFEYHLASIIDNNEKIKFKWEGAESPYPLSTMQKKIHAYDEIKNILKSQSNEVRSLMLQRINPDDKYRLNENYLTIDELKVLASSSLITIGCHTNFHHMLTAVSSSSAQKDIKICKEKLSMWLNRPIDHFSYPYGAYDKRIMGFVKNMGFSSAVTTREEVMKSQSRYALPRFDIKSYSDFVSATI